MAEIKRLQHRVRASSILEVTVAMVLLLGAFSIALIIYLNIISSHPQLRRLKYEAYLASAAREAVQSKSFINNEWKDGQVTIYKTAEAYRGNPRLMLLSLSAKDALGKTIAQNNSLVYVAGP